LTPFELGNEFLFLFDARDMPGGDIPADTAVFWIDV